MKLKHFKNAFFLIIFISLLSSPIPAEEKNNLTIDFSERFRLVSWDNPITLDSSKESGTTFTRNRTSIGINWGISEYADIYFKVTNEFRIYLDPKKDFNIHEIFVDNLYLKVRDIFKLPVTLTLGRQNVFLGEGFVVLDGSTYDGSRSAYFDAVRADINFKSGTKLILFNLYAQKTDNTLPIINKKNQIMNEHDLKGFGAYYRGRIKKHKFDIYFLNKKSDVNENGNWDFSYNTFGSNVRIRIKKRLYMTTEAAVQKGRFTNNNFDTFGGHFHIDHSVAGTGMIKKITLGGVWLSGDPTPDNEINSWDSPFSKWPKWSESYIYTLINENGIAFWSNFSSLYLSTILKLFNNGFLRTTLNYLFAPEKNNSFPFPGGAGKYRGFLMINRLNFVISKNLTGHFLWEYFRPGNFYFIGAENYNWIRFELLYKTKTRRK